ncbi:monooxygenase [Gluconacetobacter liquefaciens]|uniref:FMN-dependent oxidoreductase (Nitrilotriacetate monooxygenase family) n=1 Tax=Gluconacetobacter liquefaciens TaxID=89584 RepID=A0A370FX19_GLULI|nr:LLM class flavin-dependent oxidoreductase [Gluconacetobacter liquefaciens]MBB2187881.1 LLM class flavin-dependent oxidoreductase [Gluconacetobacter liquefaciens]RDI34234.1 FMN-dependent oxidoreductase (nitrilotriacetate monooxygenase family) [Gluconacetobacter liquefaciens]GBQ98674.1 monooxygenase-like protein [Gluconacetobacter liquefaciens NRIC 0522]GEB38802.1 monooxygenase [Gluconacetobacter liquefaciens]
MPDSVRQLRLGAFLQATGHHVAAWRHPAAQADAGHNIAHYRELAKTAERGKLDLIFLADSPATSGEVTPAALARNAKNAHFEPLTLWSALSQVTEHVGFVATSTTTYEDPYTTARKFASLDWISQGRAAWNVVTTGVDASANFSLSAHPVHDDRYARAEEFIDVVKGLWDSHEDDAFLRDRESGVYLSASKVHRLDHHGRFFQVRGPLNVGRPPQGHPVIVQAGASEPGRELAARTAEVIFTANLTLEDAQAFYADLKNRLGRHGRTADQLLIMPGIFPVLGGTEREARDNYEYLQSLIDPETAWAILRQYYRGVDLSSYTLDDIAPPPAATTNGNQSRLKLVHDLILREQPTLRALYRTLATARGHQVVVGTPEQVADAIQLWFEQGAADGFNIMPPILPTGLTDFIDEVVPILRRRGLFRHEYEGRNLRENLGLTRPTNQFSISGEGLARSA